jgi:RNA polymerase sigma-70 factor (ECF subfamily)
VKLPPDHGSFEDFYRRQGPVLRRAVCLAVGEADLGTEATDEAMTRACERWAEVSAYANPGGWAYRVALNWARSRQRRYRFRDRRSVPEEPWLPVPEDPDLAHALSKLKAEQRAVVVCRYYLDWSVDETATALGIPAGTVKSRLARALDTLKGHLEIER